MTPMTYSEAQEQHPALVQHLLSELATRRPDLDPDRISWFSVACGSAAEDLMDEGAIADHLLTGYVPAQMGVCAVYEGQHHCACNTELVDPAIFDPAKA